MEELVILQRTIINLLVQVLIFLILLVLTLEVNAQHGVSYNQFGQLRNTFNGSLSTMDLGGSLSVLGRNQWIGVEGAPKSVWVSGNIGFQDKRLSVGFDAKHATLGVVKETELAGYVAKAVRIGEDEYLSLSMGGGLIHFQGSYLSLNQYHDPSFSEDIRETNGFLSIGTSYYRPGRYYFGVSMPRFSLSGRDDIDYEFRNVYYITIGTLVELDPSFHLRPSLLVSHMDGLSPRYDLSVLLFMARKLGLGMGVQNQGDLSALMQVNFGDFGVGYSYQFSPKNPTVNQRISTNTHEVGLRYRIGGVELL